MLAWEWTQDGPLMKIEVLPLYPGCPFQLVVFFSLGVKHKVSLFFHKQIILYNWFFLQSPQLIYSASLLLWTMFIFFCSIQFYKYVCDNKLP
jgi:hypothetical protein